jgi:hypothetical protein
VRERVAKRASHRLSRESPARESRVTIDRVLPCQEGEILTEIDQRRDGVVRGDDALSGLQTQILQLPHRQRAQLVRLELMQT